MDHGRLLALDSPPRLIRSLPGSATIEAVVRPEGVSAESLVDALSALAPSGNGAVQRVEQLAATAPPDGTDAGLRLRVYVDGEPAALLGAVVGVLGARGAVVTDLSLGEPTLEDVFIHLTGRDLR